MQCILWCSHCSERREGHVWNFKHICSYPTPWMESHAFCKAVGSIQQAGGKYLTPRIVVPGGRFASGPWGTTAPKRSILPGARPALCGFCPGRSRPTQGWGHTSCPLPVPTWAAGWWRGRVRACHTPVRAWQGRKRGTEAMGRVGWEAAGRRQRNEGFDLRNSDGGVLQLLGVHLWVSWGCQSMSSEPMARVHLAGLTFCFKSPLISWGRITASTSTSECKMMGKRGEICSHLPSSPPLLPSPLLFPSAFFLQRAGGRLDTALLYRIERLSQRNRKDNWKVERDDQSHRRR